MASRRTLPDTHARVTANAQQFISEFQRADNAQRRSVASMDRELSKLQTSIKNKFSASDIGKDVLKSLGIGSGFALAQQAGEMISSYWQHAAEQAQAVADASSEQLASVRAIIASRQTDEQRRDTAWKQERDAMNEYFNSVRAQAQNLGNSGFGIEARMAGSVLDWMFGSVTDAQVAQKRVEWQKALQAYDEFARKVEDRNKTQAVNSALDQFFAPLDAKSEANFSAIEKRQKDIEQLANRIAEANEWRTKTQLEYSDALQKEADALMKSIATPQEEHIARMKRIETLYQSGKLTVEQYTRAMTESFKTLDSEESKNVEKALDNFFGELDKRSTTTIGGVEKKASEFEREMAAMWNNVSDRAGEAFADMVLTGEASFSKLADIAARSILEIVARMAIINPLINAIFGFQGGDALPAFYGAGAHRARGGAVEPGYTYRVNEDGQEFFKPSVGGTIMPVGASKGLQKQAGNTYVFHLPGGISESVFNQFAQAVKAALGPGAIERRAVAAVTDHSLRMA